MAVVALYTRVSTTRQADADLSIPDQIRAMRQWCQVNGHTIAVEYVEPGASATDDRRPVFQQLIEEATRTPGPLARSLCIVGLVSFAMLSNSNSTDADSIRLARSLCPLHSPRVTIP